MQRPGLLASKFPRELEAGMAQPTPSASCLAWPGRHGWQAGNLWAVGAGCCNNLKARDEIISTNEKTTETIYDAECNKKGYMIQNAEGTKYYDENGDEIDEDRFDEIFYKLLE